VTLLRRNRWTARALVATLVVLLLVAFARIEHTTPLLLPMVLLVCAVVAIAGMVSDSGGTEPPAWEMGTDYTSGVASGQDVGLAGNIRLLENHLSARQADPLLRGRLARMTDERLGRLGLRRGDPGVAARLGPTLTAVLDGPPRILRVEEIEECIRRIEELSP
jgi:hypothetical protein